MNTLTWAGFGFRLLFALLLVFLTYNPSGYSYVHWFAFAPVQILSGLVLLIGWAIYCRATFRSIGFIGLGLMAALLACIVWLFVDLGWFRLNSVSLVTWIVQVCLSLILAVGMSWSHVRRRLSGQVDTDDMDN